MRKKLEGYILERSCGAMKQFGHPDISGWNHRNHLLRKGSGGIGTRAGVGDNAFASYRCERGDELCSQMGIGEPLQGLKGLNGEGEVGNQQTSIGTHSLQNSLKQVKPSTLTTCTYKSVIHYNLFTKPKFFGGKITQKKRNGEEKREFLTSTHGNSCFSTFRRAVPTPKYSVA